MERRTNLCLHHLFVLSLYIGSLHTEHFPREIIYLILGFYYRLFKIKIACGENHFLLLFDNELYSWGNNNRGQLGLGHCQVMDYPQKIDLPPIVKISAGSEHSVALSITNQLYVWGNSTNGSWPAIKSTVFKSNPVVIPSTFFGEETIKKIKCGNLHSMALTISGKLYGWGHNEYGQIGVNLLTNTNVPQRVSIKNLTEEDLRITKVACGDNFSIIIAEARITSQFDAPSSSELESQLIFSYGNNRYWQRDHDTLKDQYPYECPKILDVVCETFYSVIRIGDEIYFSGLFGGDSLDSSKMLPNKIIFPHLKKIACGCSHFILLNELGEVWAQGYNKFGQLGLGHHDNVHSLQKICSLPPIKKIFCGKRISFAISEMADIYVWGEKYGNVPVKFVF
jgi:alpha-tubulin suppressor-like RCC1 family protein